MLNPTTSKESAAINLPLEMEKEISPLDEILFCDLGMVTQVEGDEHSYEIVL